MTMTGRRPCKLSDEKEGEVWVGTVAVGRARWCCQRRAWPGPDWPREGEDVGLWFEAQVPV